MAVREREQIMGRAPGWMRRALEIAREVFPEPERSDDDFLGYAIWNETGYPCFLDDPPEKYLRAQLEAYRDSKMKA